MSSTTSTQSGQLLCPFCLHLTRFSALDESCSECGEIIPARYHRESSRLRPLVTQVLGLSGHGKTSYLVALSYTLSRLSVLLPGYRRLPATSATQGFVSEANSLVMGGQLPKSGPADRDQPQILLLSALERWGDVAFIFRDSDGRSFKSMDIKAESLPLLTRSPASLLFVSPYDLAQGDQPTVDLLMNNYLAAMEEAEFPLDRHGLVLVLSKADLLQRRLPPSVQRYLKSDPLWPSVRPGPERRRSNPFLVGADQPKTTLEDYLDKMDAVHDTLRDWLSKDPHYRDLFSQADQNRIELRLSVVSATGDTPREDNTLPTSWSPTRVIDPFLSLCLLDEKLGGLVPGSVSQADDRPRARFEYSLRVRSQTRAEVKANLTHETGDLGRLVPELSSLGYRGEPNGVLFSLGRERGAFVRRGSQWEQRTGESILVLPAEILAYRGWEIEVRSSYFSTPAS